MTETADDALEQRLFVAVDLPGEVRHELGAWMAKELTDPALRTVRPEKLHITLCFLGDVSFDRRAKIGCDVLNLPVERLQVRLEPDLTLLPRSRPRLIAASVDSASIASAQEQLSRELETTGVYEPEDRPYWPHVTLARVRNRKGGRGPQRLQTQPGALPASLTEPFDAVRIALYRSNIRSDGAHYESLANLDLKPAR